MKQSLQIGIPLFGVGILFARHIVRLLKRPVVSKYGESMASLLVDLLDEVTEDPACFLGPPRGIEPDQDIRVEGVASVRPVRSGCLMRCAVATALLIRSETGTMTRSEANRLCVVTFASRLLKKRNVRAADIARMLPIIEMAMFTPMEEEIMSQEMKGAAAIVRKVERAEAKYTSKERSLWLQKRWRDIPSRMEFEK